jgi:hypothetical protein
MRRRAAGVGGGCAAVLGVGGGVLRLCLLSLLAARLHGQPPPQALFLQCDANAQPFGDVCSVLVVRVGAAGGGALTSDASAAYLDEIYIDRVAKPNVSVTAAGFQPAWALSSVALPCTLPGTGVFEGLPTGTSPDVNGTTRLVMPCYNATAGTPAPGGAAAADVPRLVASVWVDGSVATTSLTSSSLNGLAATVAASEEGVASATAYLGTRPSTLSPPPPQVSAGDSGLVVLTLGSDGVAALNGSVCDVRDLSFAPISGYQTLFAFASDSGAFTNAAAAAYHGVITYGDAGAPPPAAPHAAIHKFMPIPYASDPNLVRPRRSLPRCCSPLAWGQQSPTPPLPLPTITAGRPRHHAQYGCEGHFLPEQ